MLPQLVEGDYPLKEIYIESKYPAFITYDSEKNSIEFSGNKNIDERPFYVRIKLVDWLGRENAFIQTIWITPNQESEEGDFEGEESEDKPPKPGDDGEDKPSMEDDEVELPQKEADAEDDDEEKPEGKKGSDD